MTRKLPHKRTQTQGKKVHFQHRLNKRMQQHEIVANLALTALAIQESDLFLDQVVVYLVRILEVDFVKILQLDEKETTLTLQAGIGWKKHKMRLGHTTVPLESSVGGYTLKSKHPLIISDLKTDKRFKNPAMLREHKITSGINVIIPGVTRRFGVLGVYTKAQREFTKDDVSFLQSIANIIALSYERNKTEEELRRFQYMADNANIGISLIDKEGRFKYVNKITYERLGFSREEYSQKRVKYQPEDDSAPQFKRLFNRIQKETVPSFETHEFTKGTREKIPVEINVTGVKFAGEPYMFAVSQDISDRVKAQMENARLYSEIESQTTRLNNIVTNVPGVVWEKWLPENRQENRVNYVSNYVEAMTGYSPHEWSSREFWFPFIHPEDRAQAQREFDALLKDGKTTAQHYRWIHKNGKIIWVESFISVVRNKRGKIIGLRGVSMDASERMELEKRKDEFISMASHELKTPVTTLKVFTQILQKQAERSKDYTHLAHFNKMDTQISRLTDLINDLLDLSKIQTGKLSFRIESFNINELVHEIVEQMQAMNDHHMITVHGAVNYSVCGDRDRLGQVLINLITNAVKYSPQSDKIVVSLSSDSKLATISVQDFGIGIASDEQKKIFERFYQSPESGGRTFPGLGIGLYISDEIVRRHGGTITVTSRKGKGATFSMHVPLEVKKTSFAGLSPAKRKIHSNKHHIKRF